MENENKKNNIYSTPKPTKPRHEKTNSSFDSPYLQKKEEIDEMINQRYFDLNLQATKKRKHCIRPNIYRYKSAKIC